MFTVSLSATSACSVSVTFTTHTGTATEGADYTALVQTVVIAAGTVKRDVPVNVLGDTMAEPVETFTVALTNTTGATIQDGSGTGSIVDNDGLGTIRTDVDAQGQDVDRGAALSTMSADGRYVGFISTSPRTS